MDSSVNVPLQNSSQNNLLKKSQEAKTYSFAGKIWDTFEYLLLFIAIILLTFSIQSSFAFLLDRTPDASYGTEFVGVTDFFSFLNIPLLPLLFFWFYFGQGLFPTILGGNYGSEYEQGHMQRESIFFFFLLFSILYLHIKKRIKNNPEIAKYKPRILVAVIAIIYFSLYFIKSVLETVEASNKGLDINVILTYFVSILIYGFVVLYYIGEILELKYKKIIYFYSSILFIFFLILISFGNDLNKGPYSNNLNEIDPPGKRFSNLNSKMVIYPNLSFYSKTLNSEITLIEASISPVDNGEEYVNGQENLYLKFEIENPDELENGKSIDDLIKIKYENGNLYGSDGGSGEEYINELKFFVGFDDHKFEFVFLDSDSTEFFILDFSKPEAIENKEEY